ncbi:MAG: hypothetical protein N3I35_04430 [Clostridia bacterium]|nr:hypothetical protein [Clostridia bacterium]
MRVKRSRRSNPVTPTRGRARVCEFIALAFCWGNGGNEPDY